MMMNNHNNGDYYNPNNNDTSSVASSTTNWSSSLFSWLPGGGGGSVGGSTFCYSTTSSLQPWQQEKQREISSCLNGNSDEEVDLWKLRELALSRGGLVSSSIRKRAWPKLVGSHEQLLMRSSKRSTSSSSLEVSNRELLELEKDISTNAMWHIQNHVQAARKLQRLVDLEESRPSKRVVTFASPPGLVVSSPDTANSSKQPNSSTTMAPPPVMSITTTTSSDPNISLELTSPMSGTTSSTPNNNLGGNLNLTAAPTPSTTAVKKETVTLSRHEIKALTNVILSVLRTKPTEDEEGEEQYHYVSGLHNLAALLLINLESPSLTSMTLGKLACFHLRDALRGDRAAIPLAVQLVVPVLLQTLDPVLHQHLLAGSRNTPLAVYHPIASWIQNWFAEQHPHQNVAAASRLLDVFLASHALMPIYLSVAVIMHPESRCRILDTPRNLRDLTAVLRNLPSLLVEEEEEEDPMELWEGIIETAISYMNLVPLDLLGALIGSSSILLEEGGKKKKSSVTEMVASVKMCRSPPPSWTTCATAPTDWSLLQQAKQLRLEETRNRNGTNGETQSAENTTTRQEKKVDLRAIQTKYPLAVATSGLVSSSDETNQQHFHSKRTVLVRVTVLLLLILGMVAAASAIVWWRSTGPAMAIVPEPEQMLAPQRLPVAVPKKKVTVQNNNKATNPETDVKKKKKKKAPNEKVTKPPPQVKMEPKVDKKAALLLKEVVTKPPPQVKAADTKVDKVEPKADKAALLKEVVTTKPPPPPVKAADTKVALKPKQVKAEPLTPNKAEPKLSVAERKAMMEELVQARMFKPTTTNEPTPEPARKDEMKKLKQMSERPSTRTEQPNTRTNAFAATKPKPAAMAKKSNPSTTNAEPPSPKPTFSNAIGKPRPISERQQQQEETRNPLVYHFDRGLRKLKSMVKKEKKDPVAPPKRHRVLFDKLVSMVKGGDANKVVELPETRRRNMFGRLVPRK